MKQHFFTPEKWENLKLLVIKVSNFLFLAGAVPFFLACMVNLFQGFFGVVWVADEFLEKFGLLYVMVVLTARIDGKKNSILD